MLRMVQDLASGIPAAERAGLRLRHSCRGREYSPSGVRKSRTALPAAVCAFFCIALPSPGSKLPLGMQYKKTPAFYAEDFLLVA